jgi:tryptophan halogenase
MPLFRCFRGVRSARYARNRGGGAFWARARVTPVGVDLVRRIGVFRARGEVVHYEHESFSPDDWQALLLGHGVLPETWDPAVDRTAPEHLQDELRRILGFIRRKVEAQRPHAQYLQKLCASPVVAHRERRPD